MPKLPPSTATDAAFAACRPPDGYDHLLTRKGVAAHFRISIRHLEELEKRHAVPVIRAGRSVRYDKHALDYLTDALRVKPPNHTPTRSNLPSYGAGYEAVAAAVAAARARRADPKKR